MDYYSNCIECKKELEDREPALQLNILRYVDGWNCDSNQTVLLCNSCCSLKKYKKLVEVFN